MKKVPSAHEADDGVPADVGLNDDDVEESETVAVVLDELSPPGRQFEPWEGSTHNTGFLIVR